MSEENKKDVELNAPETPAPEETESTEQQSAPQEAPVAGEAADGAPAEAEAEKKAAPEEKKKTKRRRILKWTLIGIGIFFAVVLLLLILAVVFRDPLIVAGVRLGGTEILGTKVELRMLDTSLTKGTVHLSGFSVDNPAGFDQRRKALLLGDLQVKINVKSVFTKKIEVEYVRIDGLQINCESDLSRRITNLQDLADTAQKRLEGDKKSDGKQQKKKEEEKPSDVQVVIRVLALSHSSLSLDRMTIPINMELNNIGEGQNLDELLKDFAETFKKITDFTGGIISTGGKTLQGGWDGLKGLFGK